MGKNNPRVNNLFRLVKPVLETNPDKLYFKCYGQDCLYLLHKPAGPDIFIIRRDPKAPKAARFVVERKPHRPASVKSRAPVKEQRIFSRTRHITEHLLRQVNAQYQPKQLHLPLD